MKISIGNYQDSEFEEIIKLLDEAFGTNIDPITFNSHYVDESHNIIVARTEESVICGCALYEKRVDYLRDNPILFVSFLAVGNQYKRQGVGRALMTRIEELCKEMNCNAIELTSADYRVDAHRFYNEIGFSRKKTTVFIKEIR